MPRARAPRGLFSGGCVCRCRRRPDLPPDWTAALVGRSIMFAIARRINRARSGAPPPLGDGGDMEALLSVDGESRDEAALIQMAVSASCLRLGVLRLSGVCQASQDGSRRFDLISLDATCSWIWNASPPTLGLFRRRVGWFSLGLHNNPE